jgi:hypothetical protein
MIVSFINYSHREVVLSPQRRMVQAIGLPQRNDETSHTHSSPLLKLKFLLLDQEFMQMQPWRSMQLR